MSAYAPGIAYLRGWRRRGLILVPVGVTAEDRFGDVVREMRAAERDLREHINPDHQESA